MYNVQFIKLEKIHPNANQPRLYFDEQEIKSLAASIQANGLIQPITVRKDNHGYAIVTGERRYRACKLAQLDKVPCYVINVDQQTSAELAIVENIQRVDLSAIEEAKAYVELMALSGMCQIELARKMGKSQSAIANKIRLLQLPTNIQQAVASKQITERHGRALLKLDESEMNKVLDTILSKNYNVAQTENYVQQLHQPKKKPRYIKSFNKNALIAINTIKQSVKMVEKSGFSVEQSVKDQPDCIEITIKIKK